MTRRRPYAYLLLSLAALVLLFSPAAHAGLIPKLLSALPAAFDKPAPADLADLKAMEQHVQKVVEKVLPCTVNVRDGGGQGSGVIVSADGYVLTAGHVSREAGRTVDLTLSDGRKVKAKTLGANHNIDSGLMKIIDPGKWPYAEMGKSADLKPGQWVVTTGHPGGYNANRGTVVRLGRVLRSATEFVRTDCTIVGGDSGGPLFDLNGKVVGIHSRIGAQLSANIHVPVDTYRDTWERLVKAEVWGRFGFPDLANMPYMGIEGENDAKEARITKIVPNSPAAKAGLQVDDVITMFDGKKIGVYDDLRPVIRAKKIGDTVAIVVRRGKETVKVELKLGKRNG